MAVNPISPSPPRVPRIAVTLGDPVGIGPEVVVGAFAHFPELREICQPVVVGDRRVLERAAQVVGAGSGIWNSFRVHDIEAEGAHELPWGRISAGSGRAAMRWIEAAVDLCLDGAADAMTTGPIHKEAIWAAGSKHRGHTEMLATLTGSTRPLTMFEVRGIRIFFATRHMSLREAIGALKRESLSTSILDAARALKLIGTSSPRIAVAALNPHGGEGGRFGREEIDVIEPAVWEAREAGVDVTGPVAADSVFAHALEGRFDAVLALYHDQGHIAAKTLDFHGTVSVTMGLPFIRTSVDHGVAFDIAGTGKARPDAMAAAIRTATRLSVYSAALRTAYGPSGSEAPR